MSDCDLSAMDSQIDGAIQAQEQTVEAGWSVELNCECPKCKEYVNLLDYADFWDGRRYLQIAQPAKDLEVICPECHHEFNVNCHY